MSYILIIKNLVWKVTKQAKKICTANWRNPLIYFPNTYITDICILSIRQILQNEKNYLDILPKLESTISEWY